MIESTCKYCKFCPKNLKYSNSYAVGFCLTDWMRPNALLYTGTLFNPILLFKEGEDYAKYEGIQVKDCPKFEDGFFGKGN